MSVIAETALNLRATASKKGQIVTYLRHGDIVDAFGKPDKFQWQWVRSIRTGQYGFCDAQFLTADPVPAVSKPDPVPQPELDPHPNAHDGPAFWIGFVAVVGIIIAVFWTLIRSFL